MHRIVTVFIYINPPPPPWSHRGSRPLMRSRKAARPELVLVWGSTEPERGAQVTRGLQPGGSDQQALRHPFTAAGLSLTLTTQ